MDYDVYYRFQSPAGRLAAAHDVWTVESMDTLKSQLEQAIAPYTLQWFVAFPHGETFNSAGTWHWHAGMEAPAQG